MAQTIVAALPVESRLVPVFLENILDKKVAGIALNLLEELVDWILSWIYCPYNNLYKLKSARVHRFSDAITPLFDSTKLGTVSIDYEWKNDYISLHQRKVFFSPIPNVEMVFSRRTFTDYVVVQDDESRRPGWYRIIEQETSRFGNLKPMEKFWRVNTNELHQFQAGGALANEKPVYLVEQPRA